jgi:DNA-binding transcriptional LysR family regulator
MVVQSSRVMFSEWEALEQRVAEHRGLSHGRLRLSVASTAKYFIPRMLGRFCDAHPQLDISLQVLNRDGVVNRMRGNEDDLYILSAPPVDLAHERQHLLGNPLVVIAPLQHPLAARSRIAPERLQAEAFILRELGSGTRMAGDQHFASLGLSPRVRLELGSNEAVKQSVAGGLGLGLISRHALSEQPAQEGLAILPVRRFPVPSAWSVLWLKGRRLSPLAQAFVAHLQQLARSWEAHS